MKNRFDLVIIGGGAGGLVVASVASQLGLKVCLIEKNAELGGDCLHSGCVPSKTLIKAARVAHLMRHAADYGLPAQAPAVDLGKVNAHVQSVIAHIQKHDAIERFRAYGCTVITAPARFVNANEVEADGQRIHGRRFVIATGSRPFIPPIEGLTEAGFVSNKNLFELQRLPPRLVVLGGGPIGVEMAQAFSRLGSKVTVIEQSAGILPRDDSDAASALQAALADEGIVFHNRVSAEAVSLNGDIRCVQCSDGGRHEAEQVLVAVGRRPNIEALDLDAAGVRYSPRGIEVDRRLRTTQKHIYACGDVCGPYPFTHMAEYQAGIVLANAVFRLPKKTDYRVVPWVTYTDPELAQVGLTEAQAKAEGLKHDVLRFDFAANDRALAEAETTGFVKLLVRNKRLIGATLLGLHAGELIHELALAMQAGVKIGDIAATIHAYPTLAQIHRRGVNTAYAPKLFSPRTRALVKWLNRLIP